MWFLKSHSRPAERPIKSLPAIPCLHMLWEVFVWLRAGGYRGSSALVLFAWVNCSVWSEALRGCTGKWGVWSGFFSSKVNLTTWTGEERKQELEKRKERKSVRALLGSVWRWELTSYVQTGRGNRDGLWPGYSRGLLWLENLGKIKHHILLFIYNIYI